MSDIFISYAREDRARAEQLAGIFAQQGWAVWWDKVIPPGKKYADVIAEVLPKAKAVIVLWSHASVTSDWVKDEAQEGAARGILVPAIIEEIVPPFGFRQLQTADLSKWEGSPSDAELSGLLKSVAALLNDPQATPRPNPLIEKPRPQPKHWLYLLVGLVLVLGLGVLVFMLWGGNAPNQGDGTGARGDGTGARGGQPPATPQQSCDREARHKAAELTSKGLTYIDPGGNHGAAVLQFNEAIAECPDYVEAYFYRGQSFVVLGRNEKALDDFKKVRALSSDSDITRETEKFLATLDAPPAATPTPHKANVNAANTSVPTNSNANTTASNMNGSPSNANTTTTTADPVRVRDIFAVEKSRRIAATTRLIIEKKRDPEAVRLAIRSALEQPDNKSGIINTLVYLENVDPAILKQQRQEVEKLLAVARNQGAQAAEHVRKVQALLNG